MKILKCDIELFKAILADIYNLKCQPSIIIRNRTALEGHECMAVYRGECYDDYVEHQITIASRLHNTLEELFATLAHEYAHCWQTENGFDPEHNRKTKFRMWEKYFKKHYELVI